MRKKWLILCWGLVLGALSLQAQKRVDIENILSSEDDFVEWVIKHHPVAMRAAILQQAAAAQLLEARGGFDPKLYADWDQKSFDGKQYFRIGEGGVKWPSWYGLEFKAGYLVSNGLFLNPERNLPPVGQAVAEIKWSLLQGLGMDERRANLQKSNMQLQLNDAARQSQLNALLLEAIQSYWDWAIFAEKQRIQEQALVNAQGRLDGTVTSFELGDKPQVDTIEAFIQVQNRIADLNKARVYERNARIDLGNYLWYKGQEPIDVGADPQAVRLNNQQELVPAQEVSSLKSLLDMLHPDLRQLQAKLQQLDIDRRLVREQMKPRLDVSYAFLSGGSDFFYDTQSEDPPLWDLFSQNYKWNLTFNFPLFLRKARGKLEQIELKSLDTNLKLNEKRRSINNKIDMALNELQLTKQQIDLYTEMVGNYQALYEAEQYKFQIGESSVFLINAREQKLLDAQLKLIDLKGDFHKKRAKLLYAAGLLAE